MYKRQELQSQFSENSVEPFVELVFSEREGSEDVHYTVRRVPKHIRPLKRGTGFKEESGSVSLIMPLSLIHIYVCFWQ